MVKSKQSTDSKKSNKAARGTDSVRRRTGLAWPFKLIFGLLLATVIVAAVAIGVKLNLQSGDDNTTGDWRVGRTNLKEYATCNDDNAQLEASGKTDKARCLTDADIATIRRATYTPMMSDEADGKLIEDRQGYGHIDVNGQSDLKRFLDYSLSTDSSVVSQYPVTAQLASTITMDGSDYVYTFYINRPTSAACYYSCPEGMDCIVQPSYKVEVGGQCDQSEGGSYRESRGTTVVGELRINKDDMSVKLNRLGAKINVDDSYTVTLVHDDEHNLDYESFDDIRQRAISGDES